MEELALQFFPYPHVFRGERRDGFSQRRPGRCLSCNHHCETATRQGIQLCSYGLNFLRVDNDLLIAGVIVEDHPTETPARRKMRRLFEGNEITVADLTLVLERCADATQKLEADLRAKQDEILTDYRNTKTYQQEVLEALRPQLEQTLAQVHDYKQFVQQIVQNVSVLLESRYPVIPIDEKLEQADHEEAAIYWAARLMDEKLDAALFLESPARILEPREWHRFRLHGMVVKYLRVYQRRADLRRIRVRVGGQSWGEVRGNARALGIIPHTLIDNAIKYAPSGSEVNVEFAESPSSITLMVSSLGPKIEDEERGRIFDLFYRGAAARDRLSDGTGFGLASAQNIAQAHDTQISVYQETNPESGGDYMTTFSVTFEKD